LQHIVSIDNILRLSSCHKKEATSTYYYCSLCTTSTTVAAAGMIQYGMV